jgi:hypothetical protein
MVRQIVAVRFFIKRSIAEVLWKGRRGEFPRGP